MRSLIAPLVALALATSGSALAAQQLVPTKTLLVKNPPSGARKVVWKVKETASAATIVGDPTADGATLRVQLTNGGDQCVTMPASGWTAVSTLGFKYKDATLAKGPVKVAMVKKTPSGTFLVKALLKNGGPTSITVTPGNPTISYATNFTLGNGDEYCGGTATATPNPNDEKTFKVSNDGAPSGCIASCNATTTTTTTTMACQADNGLCDLSAECCSGCCGPGSSLCVPSDCFATCCAGCNCVDEVCFQTCLGFCGCR